jgi:hypothetical protein
MGVELQFFYNLKPHVLALPAPLCKLCHRELLRRVLNAWNSGVRVKRPNGLSASVLDSHQPVLYVYVRPVEEPRVQASLDLLCESHILIPPSPKGELRCLCGCGRPRGDVVATDNRCKWHIHQPTQPASPHKKCCGQAMLIVYEYTPLGVDIGQFDEHNLTEHGMGMEHKSLHNINER